MTMFDAALLKELGELETALVSHYESIPRLPSGSLSLDYCLNGGYPRGRTTLLGGEYGSGKSTLVLLAAIRAKRDGCRVAILDVERRFNMEFAYYSGLGVPGKDYALIYPKHAEGALETVRALARSGGFDLCILDSIAALSPKAEIEGDIEDQHMMLVARMLGQFFRSSENELADSGMALVMTNQIRTGLGAGFSYTTRPGGKAKDFFASVAIDVSKPDAEAYEYENGEDAKKKQNPIGMTITGKSYKNVVGPNFVPFEVPVRFFPALHTDKPAEIFDFALKLGLFTKKDGTVAQASTAQCFFEEESLGTGRAAVMATLAEKRDVQEALEVAVRAAIQNRQGVFGS